MTNDPDTTRCTLPVKVALGSGTIIHITLLMLLWNHASSRPPVSRSRTLRSLLRRGVNVGFALPSNEESLHMSGYFGMHPHYPHVFVEHAQLRDDLTPAEVELFSRAVITEETRTLSGISVLEQAHASISRPLAAAASPVPPSAPVALSPAAQATALAAQARAITRELCRPLSAEGARA